MGRPGIQEATGFGSERYSKEELVAEMGASYLCALAGIENVTLENSAAYIQGWLGALAQDRRLIFQASSAAQKAVDYIVGKGDERRQEVELAACAYKMGDMRWERVVSYRMISSPAHIRDYSLEQTIMKTLYRTSKKPRTDIQKGATFP